MSQGEYYFGDAEPHPIDLVESLCAAHEWEFDRRTENQISMEIEGQWRNYALTLAWSPREEVLRLISTFEIAPPPERLPVFYEALNLLNDQIWDGAFTFWAPQRLMCWRYGLVLAGDASPTTGQIETMLDTAISQSERIYPAIQLVCWGNRTASDAVEVAIGRCYGTA